MWYGPQICVYKMTSIVSVTGIFFFMRIDPESKSLFCRSFHILGKSPFWASILIYFYFFMLFYFFLGGGHTYWWNSVHDCFFPCSFSAESCTINVLYGIYKLPCKINQRELERLVISHCFVTVQNRRWDRRIKLRHNIFYWQHTFSYHFNNRYMQRGRLVYLKTRRYKNVFWFPLCFVFVDFTLIVLYLISLTKIKSMTGHKVLFVLAPH